MAFSIEIQPSVPAESEVCLPADFSNLDYEAILRQHSEEYDVLYHVDGQIFGYYPSSVVTVLNDLHWEWEQTRDRLSHSMTLSGYTVLTIEFIGDLAFFSDPVATV